MKITEFFKGNPTLEIEVVMTMASCKVVAGLLGFLNSLVNGQQKKMYEKKSITVSLPMMHGCADTEGITRGYHYKILCRVQMGHAEYDDALQDICAK